MDIISNKLFSSIKKEELVGLATVINGPGIGNKLLIYPGGETVGSLGTSEIDDAVKNQAKEAFRLQAPDRIMVESGEDTIDVFIDIYSPLPRLVIIGAVHIAIPLVHLANTMGYHTIVIDARSIFANNERFPHADELIIDWPSDVLEKLNINEATYIVTLTHDEKFDNPVLQVALSSKARYIGALGSKKTHAKRVESLKEMGLQDEDLARIHAPIGLKLGGRTPEEIALSIMAEIVSVRHGK